MLCDEIVCGRVRACFGNWVNAPQLSHFIDHMKVCFHVVKNPNYAALFCIFAKSRAESTAQLGFENAVWKIQYFSVTQILRELNIGGCRSAKSAILTHSTALNFDFL